MLASLLSWPQFTNAKKIEFCDNNFRVKVKNDSGYEYLQTRVPLIISLDKSIDVSYTPTLFDLVAATEKPYYEILLPTLPDTVKDLSITKKSSPKSCSFFDNTDVLLQQLIEDECF